MATNTTARVLALALAVVLWSPDTTTAQTSETETEASFFAGITGAGARAMGMGGAFIAIADDATAASWNPAGMCVLEKPEAAFSGQPVTSYKIRYPQKTLTRHVERSSDVTTNTVSSAYRYSSTRNQQDSVLYGTVDQPWDFNARSRSLDFASLTWPFRAGRLKLVPQVSYQRVVDLGMDYDTRKAVDTSTTMQSTSTGVVRYTYVYNDSRTVTGSTPIAGSSRDVISTVRGDDVRSSGGMDVVAGSLGISFTSKLYLGIAVNRWTRGSKTTRVTPSETSDEGQSGSATTRTTSSGSATYEEQDEFGGTNIHAGILVKPLSRWSVGAVYKQAFTMDYTRTQDYTFHGEDVYVPAAGATFTRRTTVTTTDAHSSLAGSLDWPSGWGVGTAIMPTDFLTLSLDYSRSRWADGRWNYERTGDTSNRRDVTTVGTNGSSSLEVTDSPRAAVTPTSQSALWPLLVDLSRDETPIVPRQRDTEQVRFGVEYVVRHPGFLGLVVLPLRAGAIRDGQMTKNRNDLSGVTYYGVTAGFGLVWKRFSLDVAWVHTRGGRDESYGNTVLKPTTATSSTSTTNSSTTTNENRDQATAGDTLFRSNRLLVSGVIRLF